jgi:hypothetical protein
MWRVSGHHSQGKTERQWLIKHHLEGKIKHIMSPAATSHHPKRHEIVNDLVCGTHIIQWQATLGSTKWTQQLFPREIHIHIFILWAEREAANTQHPALMGRSRAICSVWSEQSQVLKICKWRERGQRQHLPCTIIRAMLQSRVDGMTSPLPEIFTCPFSSVRFWDHSDGYLWQMLTPLHVYFTIFSMNCLQRTCFYV